MNVLLSTAYLPSIEYMGLFLSGESLEIESAEHFIRQSYRTRAVILSPNGPLSITIPVEKSAGERSLTRDVKISWDFGWQRIHWLSLESCYRRSAWFEFFEDQMHPLYEQKQKFLLDYNQKCLESICAMIGRPVPVFKFTEEYVVQPSGALDFRNLIHPKKPLLLPAFTYSQVFSKGTFHAGLSVIDLLMNEGRGAFSLLQKHTALVLQQSADYLHSTH